MHPGHSPGEDRHATIGGELRTHGRRKAPTLRPAVTNALTTGGTVSRVAILVDPPQVPGHGRFWAHVASDCSYTELHAFAHSVGLPEGGFDGDHYDIPEEAYDRVVAAGAEPVSSRELVSRLRAAGLRRPRPRRART